MTTPIKIKRSGTASSTPSSLDHGELAINYADATLFWKDSSNVIRSFVFQAYASATHKSQHATGGSDALTPADIGAAPAASPTFSGTVTARNDAGSNTFPLTVANGQDWAWGVGINFAQPATIGGAIADTARLVSDFDSTGNFSFRVHTMGTGGLAERMRITGAGRLVINAATDTVNHMIVARGSSTGDGAILLKSSATGTASNNGFLLQCFGANSDAYVWQYENSPLIFGTNATERMRLTAGGSLGIGRTSPASALDVNGVITVSATSGSAGSYAPSLTFSGDANTGFGQVSGQSDTASIFTAGHERVRVDANGNVGIGVSVGSNFNSGFRNLVVGNGGGVRGITIYANPANAATIAFADGLSGGAAFAGFITYLHADDAFSIGTNATARVRISSAGHVGLLTDAPTAALDINSDTIRVRTARTPASATAAGNAGDICWDASYLYICTATNTWRRIAHSTW